MDTSGLGTWRNPPLAYVVAELIISPYYSLRGRVPGLQDDLRASYPRTIESQELLLEGANAPTPQPIWRLLSANQGQGVQLGTRAVSLHATLYRDSRDFLDRWSNILRAVEAALPGAFVERAGLRFVDLLIPSEGRVLSDYLAPGLRGVELEPGVEVQSAMWQAVFTTDKGELVHARVGAPTPEGTLLPPNFNALPLQKPSVMLKAEKRLSVPRQPIGFIDTDCSKDVQGVFDVAHLSGLFADMQQTASRTFRALISETANTEWR